MGLLDHRTDLVEFYRALGSREATTAIEAGFQPTIAALDLRLSTPPVVGVSPLFRGWSAIIGPVVGEFGILELTATGPLTGFPNARGFYVLSVAVGAAGSNGPNIDTSAATRVATSAGTPFTQNWSGPGFVPPRYSGIGSELGTATAAVGQQVPGGGAPGVQNVFPHPLYIGPDQRFHLISRIANALEVLLIETAEPPDSV